MPSIKSYKTKKGIKYEFKVYVERFGQAVQIHRRGFTTKAEAKTALEEIMDSKENICSSNITFKKLYEEYHKAYVLRNKKQSIRRTESYFKNHVLPFFQNAIISKITEKDYMDWQEKVLSKNYSDSFNQGLHTAMVSILKYGQKTHSLTRNVAQEVGGFKKRNIKKKYEVWNYDEYKKFLNVIDDIRDKALFMFLYETGVRFGEAAAITFEDFYGSYVEINKTLAKELDENKNHILNTPKTTSSNRVITLSENVIKIIKQLEMYYAKCIGFDKKWYIIGGIKPYSHTTATNHKNKYCALAGVKQITLHSFRHSHASLMINSGIPITDISERFGHANPGITLGIYSHMIRKEKDPIIETLNKLNS